MDIQFNIALWILTNWTVFSFKKIYINILDGIGFPGGSIVKSPPANVGEMSSVPGLGRSPRGGNSNPLQYSCPENRYGQRSLAGYSLGGLKELDMTERLSTIISNEWMNE